jgi:hypothetical protein
VLYRALYLVLRVTQPPEQMARLKVETLAAEADKAVVERADVDAMADKDLEALVEEKAVALTPEMEE